MEWSPQSGRQVCFPEVDRAEWFADVGHTETSAAQRPLIDRLEALLDGNRRR